MTSQGLGRSSSRAGHCCPAAFALLGLFKRGDLKGLESDAIAIALVSSAALHRVGKVVNSDPLDRGLLIEHRRCFS